MYTLGENSCIFSRTVGEHDHEPFTETALIKKTVCNSVKRKLEENPCGRPFQLVHRELDENSAQILSKKDITKIAKNVSYYVPIQRQRWV